MEAPSIAARLRVARIVWLAIFATPAFFIVVLFLPRRSSGLFGLPLQQQVLLFGAIAAVNATLSVLLPRRHLAAAIRRVGPRVEDRAGEQVGSFQESALVRRVVVDPEGAVRAVFPAFQVALQQGLAMAESVAIFGMLVGYAGNPPVYSAPFFAVAWVLMATKFPRLTQITHAIEASTGAECRLPAS